MLKANSFLAIFLFPFLIHAKGVDLHIGSGTQLQQGVLKLEWINSEGAQPAQFEVQQATNEEFTDAKIIYQGFDQATFISGLNDGTYYYRLRATDGSWSDSVSVTVKHHSLYLALVLLFVGAIVFFIVLGVIIKGVKNQQPI